MARLTFSENKPKRPVEVTIASFGWAGDKGVTMVLFDSQYDVAIERFAEKYATKINYTYARTTAPKSGLVTGNRTADDIIGEWYYRHSRNQELGRATVFVTPGDGMSGKSCVITVVVI